MKLTVYSFFALLLIIACKPETNDVTTKYIAHLESENESLKKEIDSLKNEVKNKSELSINEKTDFSLDDLLEFNRLFNASDYVKIVKEEFLSSGLFMNKTTLLEYLYNKLEFENNSILGSFLSNDMFWTNTDGVSIGDFDSSNSLSQFNYLWNKIDRSPENINKLISEKDKQFLYSLFKGNNYYKKSGTQSLVEGLLLSYKEINDSEYLLERFHNFPVDFEFQYDLIDEATTSEMLEVLADYNYSFYNENTDLDTRVYYVYSFWARRFKEGNSELVNQMLQELHENVVKE